MAYTLTELEELRQAIATGVQRVRFSDGRETNFRSLSEMRRIEAAMAAELEPTQTVPVRRHYFNFVRP